MKNKLSLLILLFFFCFSFSFGQEKVIELKDKRITIKMDKQPLRIVLKHLIENYDVAIGFEESTLDQDHNDYYFETNLPIVLDDGTKTNGKGQFPFTLEPNLTVKSHKITVNIENGSLENALNIITGQMENYKWEIIDDVVNIFPIKGRDERYEKLLELNIKKFDLDQGNIVGRIRTLILDLPELNKFLSENKMNTMLGRAGYILSLNRQLEDELNFSNLTFRELLNKITKVKRGGWRILKKNDLTGLNLKDCIEIDI